MKYLGEAIGLVILIIAAMFIVEPDLIGKSIGRAVNAYQETVQ